MIESLTKMSESNEFQDFQQFLDHVQYNRSGVKRYEWIFGETFLSTGGLETTKEVLSQVKLGPGQKVLDIGSGTGGHAFYMAENFGCYVYGIDLSQNMMDVAVEHLSGRPSLQSLVKFEIKDCTTVNLTRNDYDLVYSRDALLHIENKRDLFANIMKWLKPGGKILFTDYIRGEDPTSYTPGFKEYLAKRAYHLVTLSEYKKLLENSGFINVKVIDWKQKMLQSLDRELKKLQNRKQDFLANFSYQDYHDLEFGWLAKIQRISQGEQGWVFAYGEKPDY